MRRRRQRATASQRPRAPARAWPDRAGLVYDRRLAHPRATSAHSAAVGPQGASVMLDVVKQVAPSIPFDTDRLDRLMDEAGIDVLLATSKHNVQYLLGGHRAFFFESMDAMGLSRYLPVFVYPKGAAQKAAFFGHRMEGFQKENVPFWVSEVQTNSSGSVDVIEKAIDYIRKSGVRTRRIAAELAFLPVDSGNALRAAFAGSEIVDGLFVLERLRAIKTAEELEKLRQASEGVIAAMLAVIAGHGPGATTRGLTQALRREETNRGLVFDYFLITAGTQPTPPPVPRQRGAGGRVTFSPSIPAAIITAISATSAEWRSTASLMPSSRICWARSRKSSARQ